MYNCSERSIILRTQMIRYIFLLFMLITTNIFAKDTPFTVSVSLVSMGMDYTEYNLDGNFLDSENSSYLELGGVETSLGYTISEDLYSSSEIIFNLMIVAGETAYNGSYIESGLPAVSTTLNTIIDKDISYKQSRVLNSELEISYGIGLGHRYWERILNVSQVEEYTWYSIRPMLGISTINEDRLNLGIFIEYQYGFNTKMSASNLNHTFTLGGADILEVSFPVNYSYSQRVDLFFEATLQKQMITESDRLYTGNGDEYWCEPESTAYNSYLKFGIEYDF